MVADTPKTRRTPLAVQLLSVLAVGAIGVALLVAEVVTERSGRQAEGAVRETIRQAAVALARRAAPLLRHGDDLRLAVLAASVADVSASRVILLDREGVVRLDTGLTFGGRKLELETADGTIEREIESERTADRPGVPVWEVCTPVLSNSGFVGEARVQYRLQSGSAAVAAGGFAWDVFGLTLLGSLSIVVLAWWLVHHWVTQLRKVARGVHEIRETAAALDENVRFAPVASSLSSGLGGGGDVLTSLSSAVKMLRSDLDAERTRSREAGLELARRLVRNLEQRDLTLAGHGDRTKRYAMMIAEAIDYPEDAWNDLGVAASLIDLGKASVRASALKRGAELSNVERESLRSAPKRGASFLVGLPQVASIALSIRHHHEKYDGSGYPDGLRSVRIPLASRILAIADAYDLLTEGEGICWPDALDSMRSDRGEHFDPELLDVFEQKIRANPTPMPTESAVILGGSERPAPYKIADEEPLEDVEIGFEVALEDVETFVEAEDVELELLDDVIRGLEAMPPAVSENSEPSALDEEDA